ncbi:serine/arginine repetitive matrix protein 2 [Streptomyces pratensis]|uniref:serine/arginine repetitive matrix protein 2 n=1 Tax=Streptomyces pratensis TaxID=1169025 RepID=UPI00301A38BC
MARGGGVRWNDETQSWETEPARVPTPPPAAPAPYPPTAAPAPPPAPPGPYPPAEPASYPPARPGPYPSAVPGPYPESDPYSAQGTPAPYGEALDPDGAVTAAGPARARITPLTAGLAVAVLAAAAASLWFAATGGEDGRRDDARGHTSSVAADRSAQTAGPDPARTGDAPSEALDVSGAASPGGAPPAGYRTRDDEEGFRIAVPKEWDERTRSAGAVFYKPAAGPELLQVFRVAEPGMTALEAVRAASAERRGSPGFDEVRVGVVDNPAGGEAAELVYAYDHAETGGRRQVVERVFTAADGRLYAVLVAAPADDWPRHEEILDTAVTHFEPYGTPF